MSKEKVTHESEPAPSVKNIDTQGLIDALREIVLTPSVKNIDTQALLDALREVAMTPTDRSNINLKLTKVFGRAT